jgi:peroxiredoxin family protein
MVSSRGVPHWLDTLRAAREIGNVRIFACSATMELFNMKLEDLEDVVDEVTGVATFIDRAKDAKISMFIARIDGGIFTWNGRNVSRRRGGMR